MLRPTSRVVALASPRWLRPAGFVPLASLRWLRFTHPTHFRSTPSGSQYEVSATSGFAGAHPEVKHASTHFAGRGAGYAALASLRWLRCAGFAALASLRAREPSCLSCSSCTSCFRLALR